MIRVGIDPGSRYSGISEMYDGALNALFRLNFIDLCDRMKKNWGIAEAGLIKIYIEDVELIKPTWNRKKTTRSEMLKISQNVGMVKCAGRFIVDQLKLHDIEYELVPPVKGYLKRCKEDKELFNKLMNWHGKSSEHSRDASVLLYQYLTTS